MNHATNTDRSSQTPDGKFNSGYYLSDDSKFMLQAELINYLPTEQTVYLQVDMEYVNGRIGGDVMGSGLAAPGECFTPLHCDLELTFRSMYYDYRLAPRKELSGKGRRGWLQGGQRWLHHFR